MRQSISFDILLAGCSALGCSTGPDAECSARQHTTQQEKKTRACKRPGRGGRLRPVARRRCSEAVLGARATSISASRDQKCHVTESWTDSFFQTRISKCGCPSGGGHVNFRKKQVDFGKSSIMGRPVVASFHVPCRQGLPFCTEHAK